VKASAPLGSFKGMETQEQKILRLEARVAALERENNELKERCRRMYDYIMRQRERLDNAISGLSSIWATGY